MNNREKLTKIFNRSTIKQQLYFMYTVVVIVPITLIGMFLLINNYRMMVNYHRDLLESDNLRVRNILFEITTQIYNISENISFDVDLQRILTGNFEDREAYLEAVNVVPLLDNYEENYTEISGITVYTDNPSITDYKQFVRVNDEIAVQGWYQKAISQSGVFWEGMSWQDDYGNEYFNLCLVRKIPLMNSPYYAVLVIQISDNYLRTRVDSTEYITMVSVDKGFVFYSSDRMQYGKEQLLPIDYEEPYYQYMGQARREGNRCFVNISTLHTYQSDSKIYICTVNEQGYKSIQNILYICLAIILVAILIPGIMIYIFTTYFTERVNVLRQEMHKASNQDYELISTFQGNDELSEAFADLQVMVQNIKEQEARAYEAQISEKELMIQQQDMEFKMLASQINPHFLYNTLETIRMKAFTAGDKEVATAIKLLGKSMRYVLENTGTSFTTLEEELNHVEIYMMIQKLRFGERIQYEKEIEAGLNLQEYRILPLLLQPVVENAIVHGLEDMEPGGKIKLFVHTKSMEEESLLLIDVIDNGCGMTQEVLDKLRKDIEIKDISRSKSIGLYNINQRIKLNYGEQYRIHVYSELQNGTTVRLMFPLDKMKQG
ncbi:MAG: histidine kinase [Lachnospiraceae bacterium]|nr:histidine kinase [Lachnospiraceae bacterium]